MSGNVLSFSETVQNSVNAQGIQISKGLKSFLLTDKGKKANALLAEFKEDEQGKIKEVYGIISEKLIKKADASSTATASEIVSEIEKNIEVEPEVPKEPVE